MSSNDPSDLLLPDSPAGTRLGFILDLERRGVPDEEVEDLREGLAPQTQPALDRLVDSFRTRAASLGWFRIERVTADLPTRIAAVLEGTGGLRVHVAATVEPEPPHRVIAIMHTDIPEPTVAIELEIDSGTAVLAVRDFGGGGAPLLLLHGGGGTSQDWDSFVPHLASNWRPVAFDLRGHGQTDGPPFSFGGTAEDVAAVMTALDLHKPVVVGHSLGGVAAVYAAVAGADVGMAVNVDGHLGSRLEFLADAGLPTESAESAALEAKAWAWEGTGLQLDQLLQQRLIAGHPRESAVRRRYLETGDGRLRMRPSSEENAAVTAALLEAPISEWHRECPVPVLAIVADAERFPDGDPDRLKQAKLRPAETLTSMPHITLERIECGHRIPMEAPMELATLLNARLPSP